MQRVKPEMVLRILDRLVNVVAYIEHNNSIWYMDDSGEAHTIPKNEDGTVTVDLDGARKFLREQELASYTGTEH